jgi:hypothetical protein
VIALQIFAVVFALLGTWLLRKPGPWMPWAFVAWLVSNPLSMLFMAIQGNWWFFTQYAIFFALAIEGAWHWLVKPALKQAEENMHVDVR